MDVPAVVEDPLLSTALGDLLLLLLFDLRGLRLDLTGARKRTVNCTSQGQYFAYLSDQTTTRRTLAHVECVEDDDEQMLSDLRPIRQKPALT